MLVLPQFCKPDEATEPAVAAFAAGCGPLAAAACMAVPMGLSICYFSYLAWTQLAIAGAAVLAATAGGTLLCRATGGLKRDSLLAANLLTQIVFILAYLANQ